MPLYFFICELAHYFYAHLPPEQKNTSLRPGLEEKRELKDAMEINLKEFASYHQFTWGSN
jgi:hypothetical protein